MGCGQKAAAMEEEEKWNIKYNQGLKKISIDDWKELLETAEKLYGPVREGHLIYLVETAKEINKVCDKIRSQILRGM